MKLNAYTLAKPATIGNWKPAICRATVVKLQVITVMNGKLSRCPDSVFSNRKTGRPGLVICNYDEIDTITFGARLDNGESLSHYRLADESVWPAASGKMSIPAASTAVLID